MSLFDGRDYAHLDFSIRRHEGLFAIVNMRVLCKRCNTLAGGVDLGIDRLHFAAHHPVNRLHEFEWPEIYKLMRQHHKTCTAILRGK